MRVSTSRGLLFALLALPLPGIAGQSPAPPPVAGTDGPADAERLPVPIDGSMRLTGSLTIVVDDAGSTKARVSGYAIDRADKVPEEVRTFLARRIAGWRIDWDRDAALATSDVLRFSVQVRASPVGDGQFRLWLDGVTVDDARPPSERVRAKRMRPPEYPREMLRIEATGIVYMLLKVGRDGRVQDLFAEQVDLTVASEDMDVMRRMHARFIASAAAAARGWRFDVPTSGALAGDEAWFVRVPVEFSLHHRPPPGYGGWQYLVRGPRRQAPWQGEGVADGIGAPAPGEVRFAASLIRVSGATDEAI